MKAILKKLLITVLAVGSFSLASASELFIFQTTDVKIDNIKAKIYVGTPVKIVKNIDDKNALIEFSGMAFDNKLFINKDKSILIASIEKSTFGKKGEVKKVQAIIEKGYLTKVSNEVWEEHEEFYYEMCTQCHAAHVPTEHSMLEWDAILQTMNGFAQLDEEESAYLSRYLKANANNGFYPKTK